MYTQNNALRHCYGCVKCKREMLQYLANAFGFKSCLLNVMYQLLFLGSGGSCALAVVTTACL